MGLKEKRKRKKIERYVVKEEPKGGEWGGGAKKALGT